MNTTCTECVFNNNADGESPTCVLGKYETFKQLGCVNEEGLITRLCTTCRNTEWLERMSYKDMVNEPIQRVLNEVKNVYSLIIFDRENSHDILLENLQKTLSIKQSILPKEIVFVYTGECNLSKITELIYNHIKGTNTQYKINKFFDIDYEDEDIDEAVKKTSGLFYTLVKNGETLPSNFFSSIYRLIEVQLARLTAVLPLTEESKTGLTILRGFHVIVNGNVELTVEEKLADAISNEGNQYMVKSWDEIKSDDVEEGCK